MLPRIVAYALIAPLFVLTTARGQQPPLTVTVPAGTVIPLTLVNPIKSKSSRAGDTVRASVAFPVTVADRVAIPAGAYVEGVLGQPLPKVKHQSDPGVQIHFTRLVFANGYSAPLDAVQAAARLPVLPATACPQPGKMALLASINLFSALNGWELTSSLSLLSEWESWRSWLMVPQAVPPTTLPASAPLPHAGPSPGVLIGIGVGVPVAIIILAILFRHRSTNADFIVHDAGWQFQMKLNAPFTIDTSQIGTQIP